MELRKLLNEYENESEQEDSKIEETRCNVRDCTERISECDEELCSGALEECGGDWISENAVCRCICWILLLGAAAGIGYGGYWVCSGGCSSLCSSSCCC